MGFRVKFGCAEFRSFLEVFNVVGLGFSKFNKL